MAIVGARIDQRLIHGIIVNQWNSKLSPKRFLVIDDEVSQNPDLKSSMRMAKPVGTGMSIISFEKALANLKADKYAGQRVFLLTKEPSTIVKLLENGISIPSLNLGITFSAPDKKQISKFIFLNKGEVDDLKRISAQNVPINVQYIPDDHPVGFEKAIEGYEFK